MIWNFRQWQAEPRPPENRAVGRQDKHRIENASWQNFYYGNRTCYLFRSWKAQKGFGTKAKGWNNLCLLYTVCGDDCVK